MKISKSYTKRLVLALLLIGLVSCLTSKDGQESKAYVLEEGIVYKTVDGIDLKLDIARPGRGRGPFPGLIFISSGGALELDRRTELSGEIKRAAERGYVAVTIEYRPIRKPDEKGVQVEYPFPAPLHDAKCAVIWMRSNAEKYRIDPERIGAIGYRFPGHLALLLGLTDPDDGLESECENDELSSRVQAVVNWFGPTEMHSFYHQSISYVKFWALEPYLGGTQEEFPDNYRLASPVYVSDGDPPILSVMAKYDSYYGPMDKQGELLDAKMKEAGLSHTLLVVKPPAKLDLLDFFDSHLN